MALRTSGGKNAKVRMRRMHFERITDALELTRSTQPLGQQPASVAVDAPRFFPVSPDPRLDNASTFAREHQTRELTGCT